MVLYDIKEMNRRALQFFVISYCLFFNFIFHIREESENEESIHKEANYLFNECFIIIRKYLFIVVASCCRYDGVEI